MHGRSDHLPPAGLALGLLLAANAAQAQLRVVPLLPANTQVEFTTYAMGMFPLQGRYERFQGDLLVDSAHPESCKAALDVDVGSLAMADPRQMHLALGPQLLNQPAFPHLLYSGSCAGPHPTGMVTLHGVTGDLPLTATRDGQVITARGTLHRGAFGIHGLPGLIGDRIQITFVVHLPDGLAAILDP